MKKTEGEAYYDQGFRDARFETFRDLGMKPSKSSYIETNGKTKKKVWVVEYEVEVKPEIVN